MTAAMGINNMSTATLDLMNCSSPTAGKVNTPYYHRLDELGSFSDELQHTKDTPVEMERSNACKIRI
jgi:hypothetical protein